MSIKKSPLLLAIFALMFASLACGINLDRVVTGPTQTKTESVAAEGADSIRVDVEMGAGELNIDGGGSDLLAAEFTYNVEAWEPDVDYSVTGSTGRLEIRQPDTDMGIPDDDIENRWDLRFGDNVPMDMNISLGAGQGDLDLTHVNLESLVVNAGAGEVSLFVGGSGLTDGEFNAGVGDVTIDFSGEWTEDVTFDVSAGVGEITIVVPAGVGVRVNAETGLGGVNSRGFSRDGDAYVNDAYGESDVTLTINIGGGVGEIILRTAE